MSIELEIILNNKESFKQVQESVKRGIEILKSIDNRKEDLKTIAQDLKEKFDMAPKDFNAIVKHAYKNGIDEELEFLSTIDFALSKLKDSE